MLKAKIYYLENPVTKQPFYVGLTSNTLIERFYGHLTSNEKVKGLTAKGIFPTIELIEEVDGDISGKTEAYWIDQFRAWGFELYNSRRGATDNIYPYVRGVDVNNIARFELMITEYNNSNVRKKSIEKMSKLINVRKEQCEKIATQLNAA